MENLDPFSPPNRDDEKMVRFGFRAAYISLFWVVGRWGVLFHFILFKIVVNIRRFRYILNLKTGALA